MGKVLAVTGEKGGCREAKACVKKVSAKHIVRWFGESREVKIRLENI